MKKFTFLFLISYVTLFYQNLKDHQFLIDHIKACIEKVEKGHTKSDNLALDLEGMSGRKFIHFVNNLCNFQGASYFEVGFWKGSTFILTLQVNEKILNNVFGIDDWNQFSGSKKEFFNNINFHLKNLVYEFLAEDCFNLVEFKVLNQHLVCRQFKNFPRSIIQSILSELNLFKTEFAKNCDIGRFKKTICMLMS
jgi:hypothetical protein